MLMRASNQGVESINRFVGSLSADDRALIGERLERVTVTPGVLLLGSGMPIDFVYFPETTIISIREDDGDRLGIETAVIGYEGIVGWPGLVDCGQSTQSAVAEVRGGTVLRLPINDMKWACASSQTLFVVVMRFVEAVVGQMAQAIVSHLRDTVERRVCRWLLMRHDRLIGDQLLVRHDEIGANLGVRRASITDCLHVLEGERLIRCHRGRIVVRNRTGLEIHAGRSYVGAEAYYQRLVGPSHTMIEDRHVERDRSLLWRLRR